MKAIIAAILVLIVTAMSVYADTPLMGFISQDTTWTKASSPYFTVGNVIKYVSPYIDHCTIRGNKSGISISYDKIYVSFNPNALRLNAVIPEILRQELQRREFWFSQSAIVSAINENEWWVTDHDKECVIRYEQRDRSFWLVYPYVEDVVIRNSRIEGCTDDGIVIKRVRNLFFIGDRAVWQITIFNWGNGPLTIENIALQDGTPGFEIISSPLPYKIPAGERWDFTVGFLNSNPSADNVYFIDEVCITSDDPYRPETLKQVMVLCAPKGD